MPRYINFLRSRNPILFLNKKVLLRERKRHTARRVVSTPSVLAGGVPDQLPPPGGTRTPDPPWGGTQTPDPPRGVPGPQTPPGGRSGYPPGGSGYPPGGLGTPPGGLGTPCRGVPGPWTPLGVRVPPGGIQVPLGSGYPPGGVWVPPGGVWVPPHCLMAFWEMLQNIMGYGYPPCGQTDGWMEGQTLVKTLPSLVLRTRAVKILRVTVLETRHNHASVFY